MYISHNIELDELLQKETYVKNLDPTIQWLYSSSNCFDELKTEKLITYTQANRLLEKIKKLDSQENYPAYSIFESRSNSGFWRVVISLNLINHFHSREL